MENGENRSSMNYDLEFQPGYFIVQIILGLLTVLSNGLSLYVIMKGNVFQVSKRYFICNLSIANLFAGMVYCSITVVTSRVRENFACVSVYAMGSSACIVSEYSLVAVCWDQMVKFHFPLRHPSWLSKRKVFAVIVCIWLLAVFVFSLEMSIWIQNGGSCVFFKAFHRDYHVFAFVIIYAIPVSVISSAYVSILVVTRRHSSKVFKTETGFTPMVCNRFMKFRYELKMVSTMIIVNLVLWGAWSPLHIFSMIYIAVPGTTIQPTRLLGLIYFTSPLVIPFIYATRISSFKRALYQTQCQRRHLADDRSRSVCDRNNKKVCETEA